MRIVLTTILVFASSTAFASSITSLGGTLSHAPSVVEQKCSDCPGPKPKPQRSSYQVPSLEPGTARTEIVEIGGERKFVRTEAWLGGSPVIYVTKVPDWAKDGMSIADLHPSYGGSTEQQIEAVVVPTEGIDISATTGAVAQQRLAEIDAGAKPPALALGSFDLRLPKND